MPAEAGNRQKSVTRELPAASSTPVARMDSMSPVAMGAGSSSRTPEAPCGVAAFGTAPPTLQLAVLATVAGVTGSLKAT